MVIAAAVIVPLGILFFISGLVVNLVQALCYVLIRPLSKNTYRKINRVVAETLWLELVWIVDWWAGVKIQVFADNETFNRMGKEHALVVCNHRSDIDWLVGWILAQRSGCLGSALAVMKKSSKFLPVIGWSMWFSEYLFLERNWALKSGLQRLSDFPRPFWLALFVEGTRFTEAKLKAAQEYAASSELPVPRNVTLYANAISAFSILIQNETQGNSFQKKAALLLGTHHVVEDQFSSGNQGPRQRAAALAALTSAFNSPGRTSSPSRDRSNGNQGGTRQRAEALAALSSAFNSSPSSKSPPRRPGLTSQASQRAAALAALSQVLTAEKKTSPDTSPSAEAKDEKTFSEVEASEEEEVSPAANVMSEEAEAKQNVCETETTGAIFTYGRLQAKSENPVTGIDFKRREAYLSEEEFKTVFGMEKTAFYKLPRWKQDLLKKKFDLF